MSITEVAVREAAGLRQRVPCSLTVRGIESRLGLLLPEPWHQLATAVGHVVYSAAGGAVFGAVMAQLPPRRPAVDVVAGVAFAFALQAISYGGWLPAAKILPPPAKMSTGFNLTNVVAHAVWGAGLGGLSRARS